MFSASWTSALSFIFPPQRGQVSTSRLKPCGVRESGITQLRYCSGSGVPRRGWQVGIGSTKIVENISKVLSLFTRLRTEHMFS